MISKVSGKISSKFTKPNKPTRLSQVPESRKTFRISQWSHFPACEILVLEARSLQHCKDLAHPHITQLNSSNQRQPTEQIFLFRCRNK